MRAATRTLPRSGKELILSTREFASDDTLRSWWCVWSTIGLLAAALAGTLAPLPLLATLACSVVAGLLTVRLFVLFHDHQHRAILHRSRFASALMWCVGLHLLSPSSVWRSSHDHHHKHNSRLGGAHIGSFPVMTKAQYLRSSRRDRFRYLLARHPLTILFGYFTVFLSGMCVQPFLREPREHFDGLVAILLHATVAVLVTWFLGWQVFLFTVFLPQFLASALGSYLFYAQHNFPTVTFHSRGGWAYEIAAMESSSFLRTGPLMAWFTGNIGYHHVHHLNARIPFYRLPEAKEAIPELWRPKTTSLRPMEMVRCLRLKVWDGDAKRMVGLAECRTRRAG